MIKSACLLLAFAGTVLGFPSNVETDSRIINGNDAPVNAYPWQVSLQQPYEGAYWHFCGGSLISQNYVMSAAHCEMDHTIITIYVGSVDKFNGGIRLTITSFLRHPQYNPNDFSWDYAVIKLREPVTLSESINTIAIPGPEYDATSNFAGTATTSGWGYVTYRDRHSPKNERPQNLQFVDVPVLTDEECQSYWDPYYQPSNMICAGASRSGTCMGDSGGPLVQDINGVTTLIGATSWGHARCKTRYPGVWAKLSTVRQWIIDNTDLQ